MCATIESNLREMTDNTKSVRELVKKVSQQRVAANSDGSDMSNEREHEFVGAVKERN